MDLQVWMLKHDIETNELARIIGVTRQVIWRVKNGKACEPSTAQKIYFLTGGAVKPIENPKGMPKGTKILNRKKRI